MAAATARIAAITEVISDAEALGRIPSRRDAPRVAFATLLERGLLLPGQALYFRNRSDLQATVLADGTLRSADGRRGSIHQIGAYVGSTPACNGWEAWFYATANGDRLSIDHLREQVRSADQHGSTPYGA